MRLLSLTLRNFRQHRSTEITFFDGITGIIGKNGAGKTTLLEAIAWALYGQKALQRMDRGKAETVRSRGARAGEVPEVTLDFILGEQQFRVVRRANDAALLTGTQQLHTGTENVTRAITQLLRMDPQAFFTSFFTGQKDLAFLKDVSTKAREAYIGKLLGYERLSKARDMANTDKLTLANEISGLVVGLPDPEILKARVKQLTGELDEAKKKHEQGAKRLSTAAAALEAVAPELAESERKRSQFQVLGQEINGLRTESSLHTESVEARRKELDSIAAAETELQALSPQVEEFEKLKARNDELQNLKASAAERSGIEEAIRLATRQVSETASTIASLEQTFASARDLRQKDKALRQDVRSAKDALDAAQNDWVTRRARLEADLAAARSARDRCKEHLQQITDAGPDGVCPTCERPLGEEFGKVTGDMAAEITRADDDIGAMERELAGLKQEPSEIAKLRSDLDSHESALAEVTAMATRADHAGEQLVQEQARLADLRGQIARSEERLQSVPAGFDPEELERVRKRGVELKPAHDRAVVLRGSIARRAEVESALTSQDARLKAAQESLAVKERELAALSFDERVHDDIAGRFAQAQAEHRAASEEAIRLEGEVKTAASLLESARKDMEDQKSRAKLLSDKKAEHRHLEALVRALDELRSALSSQIKPRLEEAASEFLSQMAPERYSQMDLDDDFTPRLYEEGDYKPVVSGGEEDLLHLCLRLGVSQMIAERAGVDLCLLVLDEAFAALDDMRRENVITLLQNLKDRFPQILLITHIEAIHDMVDRCLWVDYHQPSQTSTVRDGYTGEEIAMVEEVLELS